MANAPTLWQRSATEPNMNPNEDPKTSPEFTSLPNEAFVRLYLLVAWRLIPFSASTLWRKVRRGEFPAPVRVSSQVTAWRVGDVRAWLKEPTHYMMARETPTTRNRA